MIAAVAILAGGVPAKADHGSIEASIERVKGEYGVEVGYEEAVAALVPAQLERVETAFPYLGKLFLKKMHSIHIAHSTPAFRIQISSGQAGGRAKVAGMYHITREHSTIYLYPTSSYMPCTADVLHEFGHAACYLSNGAVNVFSGLEKINGPYSDTVFSSEQYASLYAMTNASEDFAEMFALMVLGGGEHPATVGQDTILYKKYRYVQQYLLEQLGPGSTAARRAGLFLGIEPES